MNVMQKARHLTCNAVNHNDALLLQFILHEFMASHREIKNLKILCHTFNRQLEKRSSKKSRVKTLQDIEASVRNLTGACYNSMPPLYWNQEHSLLHKLNDYAAFFYHNSTLEGTKPQRLYQTISQVLLTSAQLHETLLSFDEISTKDWIDMMPLLFSHIDKLMFHSHRVAKMLPNIIKEYGGDENVIFFLLRHSQELDAALSEGFVRKILEKIYPKGLAEAKKLLTNKYQSRGFSQLLPIISSKIDNL